MKKIIMLLTLIAGLSSCAGPLWDGEEMDENEDLIIIIDNPFYQPEITE